MATNGQYFQSQKGGRCRKHAINNALGYEAVTDKSFQKYISKFNEKYGTTGMKDYFVIVDCEDGTDNILSFILRDLGIESTYHPISKYWTEESFKKVIENSNAFLQFHLTHVWANRRLDNQWYNVDSQKDWSVFHFEAVSKAEFGMIVLHK